MEHSTGETVKTKSPFLAAFLSVFIPGLGFVYIGNILKGISYCLVTVGLIIMLVHSYVPGTVMIALLLGGFYFYQIYDAFESTGKDKSPDTPPESTVSLFSAVSVLVIGIIFQMAALDILISYRQIYKLWPLILIAIGGRVIFRYIKEQEAQGGKDE
jgi:TM2 domain-containing membrane protein YozV